jgi:predicted nucleotidyltransferase
VQLIESITELLLKHPSVRTVKLVGSRSRGPTTALSDLDLEVEVKDFPSFKRDLPNLVDVLEPLGKIWDPLGDHWNYMLMLSGPLKVDIIIDVPQAESPPWQVSSETLPTIDHHFWDWTLWLGSKQLHSQTGLVDSELEKMYEHLLQPLGVSFRPTDLAEAVESYTTARDQAEQRLGIAVDRTMDSQVTKALRDAGVI